LTIVRWIKIFLFYLIVPLLLAAFAWWLAPAQLSPIAAIALTLLLIVPMGPMLYRIAFEPLQHASVLVLLMAALGVHFSLQGLALVFYGPEGIGTKPLWTDSFQLGELLITGQSLAVVATSLGSIVIFGFIFERTLIGKALRACSS